ncbi:hypothetical protein ACE6H2_009026 [Prunus campanulata]
MRTFWAARIVDMSTSTIKVDAEDTDLRLCFRIISPLKTYTLQYPGQHSSDRPHFPSCFGQTENDADRMDWINRITGAIQSVLNSQLLEQDPPSKAL